jgi:cell division control protein 6
LPYRDGQQHYIASCIKPLLQGRNGKNLFIFGAPGIGKTAAIRWVFRDLEEHSDDVVPVYINCWQKNTTYKIVVEMCDILGYKFTQNKKTEELFRIVKERLNKRAAVFAFDEIDKVEDFDFLYSILEEIYKKTILLITNYKEKLDELDERVRSRLLPETLEFPQYSRAETAGILKDRAKYAFIAGVWEKEAMDAIAAKTADIKDIRCGLYLMRAAGSIAEDESSKKILANHAKAAIEKLPEFTVKDKGGLDDESSAILGIVKENSGKKIGELFKIYEATGGKATYKTFQRKIAKLSENRFVSTEKITGGKDGTTTIVSLPKEKKLTEF